MLNKLITLICLTGAILWPAPKDFDPNPYRTRKVTALRLTEPLKIDGHLDEDLYNREPITTFIQSEPDNGKLASQPTEVWVGFDDGAVYIGARLWDSQPDSIIGLMKRRDGHGNSDEFQVAIDAYHDLRSGFFFTINPSGAIGDGTIANDNWMDDTWDGIWYGKTTVNSDGWTAEMRIPFSQLRFDKKTDYVWGINFGRQIQRRAEHSLLVWTPRGESGIVSKFAELHGISDIDPPKRMEAAPYLTTGFSSLPDTRDNPFYKGHDAYNRIGGDLKLGIGNNITLDATINPDFGQVESDPASLNLSDFETTYEEKRPFFVEGSSIFSFGSGGPSNNFGFNFPSPDFFYSRRIGQGPQIGLPLPEELDTRPDSLWPTINTRYPGETSIIGAAKISGKFKGSWSVGGLSTITAREYGRLDTNGVRWDEELVPSTTYNLARTLKEFNNGDQGLGLLVSAVHRNFDDTALRDSYASNYTSFGIDGWTFLGRDRDWAVAAWFGHTSVQGNTNYLTDLQQNSQHYFQKPDAGHLAVDSSLTTLAGNAGRLSINKEKGHLTFNAALGFIDPNFDSNNLGLTFRTDRINEHLVIGYKWYDPNRLFRSSALNLAHTTNHNFAGEKINEMFFLFGYGQLLNYWRMHFFSGYGPQTVSDNALRGGPMVLSPSGNFYNIEIQSDDRKTVAAGFEVRSRGQSQGGSGWGTDLFLRWRLGAQMTLIFSPEYSYEHMISQYIMSIPEDTLTAMYGNRYIVAQLDNRTFSANLRLNYTFSPTLSLQTYIQPFVTVGTYSDYKEFARPRSYEFIHYDDLGYKILWNEDTDSYEVKPGTGNHDLNSSFRYSSFIANAVVRWEFRPGSTLYLVWTRNSNEWLESQTSYSLGNGLGNLGRLRTNNLFALKISYWFGT